MSDTVIKVENLSKQYRIGSAVDRHRNFREALTDTFTYPFRRLKHAFNRGNATSDGNPEYIWALKDVSFEVKQGEVVGIIGRNGAGKSTLLKILARITEPTEGRATLRGRVGSLLEVGTGFHSELTGEENIYLSGTILGMSSSEISRKFDEIVAFAEVEKFINTPVKYYSSGMYMRLAFAVAAHLEPEILLVDEVLAVGDAEFQKKCLGKMGDVAKEGRTVLFVSHNMAAINNLCPRTLLLANGSIIQDDVTSFVVDRYLQAISVIAGGPLSQRTDRKGDQIIRLMDIRFLNGKNELITQAMSGEDLAIVICYEATDRRPLRNVHVAIGVHGKYNENLFHLSTSLSGGDFDEIPPKGALVCHLPHFPLQTGRYSLNLFCTVGGEIADWISEAGVIDVTPGDFFGSGKLPPPDQGVFLLHHSWSIYPS